MKGYHEIEGDGGSRVLEQVAALRERIGARLAEVRRIVAVGSGKGGVGKSTLAYRLARALRASGLEVGLLDADLNGPSQARLAGVPKAAIVPSGETISLPRTREGIALFSTGSLLEAGSALSFPSVAPGESHTWRATREFALLGEVLATADWGRRDVLLVDLPPGAERTVQFAEFLGPAAAVVLVTIPSALSREVVLRSAAALAGTENRVLGWVLNMSGYACDGCGKVRPLFLEGEGPELPGRLLARIPFDPALAGGGEPGEAASGAIAEAASSLVALLEEAP